MFSKEASILGPVTTIGPIYLVYYLATSEVPVATPAVIKTKSESTQQEKTEDSKQEEEKKVNVEEQEEEPTKKEEKDNNFTITNEVLKNTASVLNLIGSVFGAK